MKKLVPFLVLPLLAVFGLILLFSPLTGEGSDTAVAEAITAPSGNIDIDYPSVVRIGEEFALKINETKGFTAAPGNHTWVILGSSEGFISIDGNSLASSAEPTARAVRPGKVDLLLTMKGQADATHSQETTVNQIVTIQVLR